jgi:hypothetical protein
VNTAAAVTYGLLAPDRAEDLLPLLNRRQTFGTALLRRAAEDVPGGIPENQRTDFLSSPDSAALEQQAAEPAPVMFIRAALFQSAPLRYFSQMAREGLPLAVVFEPHEAERYQAVEKEIQKIPSRQNPGRTFFILAHDGSSGLIDRVFLTAAPADESSRYQVAASQGTAFSAWMQTLRESSDSNQKREAVFIGTEPRDARRISAAKIPFRFYYSGNTVSAVEWEYRLKMLGFVSRNASYWKQWAGSAPKDLRLVLGHILEKLSAQKAQAALLEASA